MEVIGDSSRGKGQRVDASSSRVSKVKSQAMASVRGEGETRPEGKIGDTTGTS